MGSGRVAILLMTVAVTAGVSRPAEGDAKGEPASIDVLIEKALKRDHGIESERRKVHSLREMAESSSRWADPVLSAEYSSYPVDTWSLGDSAMTGIQLKIQQTLVFPGKNEKRRGAASAAVEVARLEEEELQNQLVGRMMELHAELTASHELIELAEREVDELEDLEEWLHARYEAGNGNQEQIIQVIIEKRKVIDSIGDIRQREERVRGSLNIAAGAPVDAAIEVGNRSRASSKPPELEGLLREAVRTRPALTAARARAEVSRLNAVKERWERRPDPTVWIGYRIRTPAGMDDGTDFLSIGASIPIPLDYGGASRSREEAYREEEHSLKEAADAAAQEVHEQLHGAVTAWKRSFEREVFYREELLPEARAQVRSASRAYENGRVSVASITRARLSLIDVERQIAISRGRCEQLEATVWMLVGRSVAAWRERTQEVAAWRPCR